MLIINHVSHSMCVSCHVLRNYYAFSKTLPGRMDLGGCPDRWTDVFVTKAAESAVDGQTHEFDDTFCCSVQSIEFETGGTYAVITENESPWICPTWTKEYKTADAAQSPYAALAVGDLVRIGEHDNQGFTDYLTVVEVKHFTKLVNGTSSQINITTGSGSVAGTDHLVIPTNSTEDDTASAFVTVGSAGIAHIAIRLNASLNCTKIPTGTVNTTAASHMFIRQGINQASLSDTTKFAGLTNRQLGYSYHSKQAKAYPDETIPTEKYFYPLYKAANWVRGTTLVARLDHGVKQVSAVKLVGYTLVNKRAVGLQNQHEMQADDYLILRIKEIEGKVISNNHHAHGAFAILRTGTSENLLQGSTQFSAYEPSGIVCVPVNSTNATLRNMTIEVTDRMGKPAHFGRFHLWFKLLVTHG